MFHKDLIPYSKLDSVKNVVLRKRLLVNVHLCAWITGMLFMCFIILSLMIVRVSSAEIFTSNRTILGDDNSNSDSIKSDNITALESLDTVHQGESRQKILMSHPTLSDSGTFITLHPNQIKYDTLKMREKKRQQELNTKLDLHAFAGETAYLLERTVDTAHEREREREHDRDRNREFERKHDHGSEQPIYGTWRMKARRSQPQLVTATAVAPSTTGVPIVSSTENATKAYQHHVYERLPRRSSTTTSMKSELHDQIPRPPRLTSRQPSVLIRRQYSDTPINMSYANDLKPKPFQFPHDGPLPEEFKKIEAERVQVNNIQDILQHMHLGGGPVKTPPMLMMPTGLHIAGSIKNLKSSGIANFFRNKRNKKHVQYSFPVPMPLPVFGAYQPPMIGAFGQPYQRIALDQFYPFKPRSPNEVNLLAMHNQLKANRSKNKKKQKKAIMSAAVGSNLLLQHTNQHPIAADNTPLLTYPQLFAINATQKPKHKHIPFKVNLDIYPVMPSTKDYKMATFAVEEAKLPSHIRSSNAPHNPFSHIYSFPISPSQVVFPYSNNPLMSEQQIYSPLPYQTPLKPLAPLQHQPSNTKVIFPDQLNQQQLSKQQQQMRLPTPQQHNTFQTVDYMYPSAIANNANANALSNPQSNQVMVHLNVFPKQKPLGGTSLQPIQNQTPSTNPFYGSTFNINRNMHEQPIAPITAIEPGNQVKYFNHNSSQTQQPQQSISRSDTVELEPFADFEHPIVAAELSSPELLPQAAALISNKLDTSDSSPHYDHIESRSNFNYNNKANIEQVASEAQAASLFRFPVEDLIQFQVGDAL